MKQELIKQECDRLIDLLIAKNAAYGDSFSDTYNEFGMVAVAIRLQDKVSRIKSLVKGVENKVIDEKIEDTLIDIAGYSILALAERKGAEK